MRKWMLVACALALASPAQAHCDKSTVELLKFLLPYAPANFAAINGGAASPGSYQYNLTPTAEQFCPKVFILEDTAASDKFPEFWEVKFSSSERGTSDAVLTSLIKTFSPVLKAAGYQDKPYLDEDEEAQEYKLEWDGPSNTWVSVHTYVDDSDAGKIHYAIRVAHTLK